MKILHTADWHIGKKLHKHDLSADFDLFINWLCRVIHDEDINLLLVSGDIFDLANPSSEARSQYYRALMKLKRYNCKIILTGGNHDSPSMLEAPKYLLKELDIHIIGGLPEKFEDLIVPVGGTEGNPEILVAAIPFLRDADLRRTDDGETYEDRIEAVKRGIEKVFFEASENCKSRYPNTPAIAMGHLFTAGIETSESEREIQIGNLAAFEASRLGESYSYIALGHIHRPQQVKAAVPAYYSGSPFPLSFSERRDEKQVLLIDTEEGWEPKSIAVPAFRALLKVSGTFDEISANLEALSGDNQLENLIEVELQEEQFDVVALRNLDELVSNFNKAGFKIVKHRATFNNRTKTAAEAFGSQQELQDLQPKDVFLELIAEHNYSEEIQQELLSAFDELLQDIQQDENAAI